MPVIPGLIAALTILLLLTCLHWSPLRHWLDTIDLRMLVLLHLLRLLGIWLLVVGAHGRLPTEFARTGGWGDIVVAVLALAVALGPIPGVYRHHAILVWNIIGLVDLLFVAATAASLGIGGHPLMRHMLEFPLSLLPSFLVPLLIATHLLVFRRLWRSVPAVTS
ncbi:MAG: hypothetical protein HYV95_00610 [Opitutae bacterium]|nr:hypothetical protein [Opitutae bacterium]